MKNFTQKAICLLLVLLLTLQSMPLRASAMQVTSGDVAEQEEIIGAETENNDAIVLSEAVDKREK